MLWDVMRTYADRARDGVIWAAGMGLEIEGPI